MSAISNAKINFTELSATALRLENAACSETFNEAQLKQLKEKVKQASQGKLSPQETKDISWLKTIIEGIESTRDALFFSTGKSRKAFLQAMDDEKEPATVKLPPLIVSKTNQYQAGGKNASICTSCSAAFIQLIKENKPLTEQTIIESIREGNRIHETVTRNTKAQANTNFNAQQVVQHSGRGFKEIGKPVIKRPTNSRKIAEHYENELITPFLRGDRKQGNLTSAVLTKAPYSIALIYQHHEKRFVFFDSHGEPETNNQAFIRTFENPKSLCQYLATKYGYIDFPDVDFDIETGQDNPNCYELTFINISKP